VVDAEASLFAIFMSLRPSVSGNCGRVYCTLVLRREGTMDGREEGLVVECAESRRPKACSLFRLERGATLSALSIDSTLLRAAPTFSKLHSSQAGQVPG
jgi:hypothetical protein